MANRSRFTSAVTIGFATATVAAGALYLGFHAGRTPRVHPVLAMEPERGPIVYGMQSVRSDPDRIRLVWREVPGATAYRVTLMTAADESLFTSPNLSSNSWTLPHEFRSRLGAQQVYHWRLTILRGAGSPLHSDPAAFATQ